MTRRSGGNANDPNGSSSHSDSAINPRGSSSAKIRYLLAIIGIIAVSSIFVFSEFSSPPSGPKRLKPTSSFAASFLDSNHTPNFHRQIIENHSVPDWDEEFFTPIDIEIAPDPMVTLCKLNFRKYWESPHTSPMFKDLVQISSCNGKNRKREYLSKLLKEIKFH